MQADLSHQSAAEVCIARLEHFEDWRLASLSLDLGAGERAARSLYGPIDILGSRILSLFNGLVQFLLYLGSCVARRLIGIGAGTEGDKHGANRKGNIHFS